MTREAMLLKLQNLLLDNIADLDYEEMAEAVLKLVEDEGLVKFHE